LQGVVVVLGFFISFLRRGEGKAKESASGCPERCWKTLFQERPSWDVLTTKN